MLASLSSLLWSLEQRGKETWKGGKEAWKGLKPPKKGEKYKKQIPKNNEEHTQKKGNKRRTDNFQPHPLSPISNPLPLLPKSPVLTIPRFLQIQGLAGSVLGRQCNEDVAVFTRFRGRAGGFVRHYLV